MNQKTSSILLDKKNLSCLGARYAFGWGPGHKNKLLQNCYDKRQAGKDVLKSMLSRVPRFKKPFKYIGLNTEDMPDIMLSYLFPKDVMDLLKTYNDRMGKAADVSLCAMMSICGGVAAKAYLDDKISVSFGCDDSRKYADIKKEKLAIGIPKRLFNVLVA